MGRTNAVVEDGVLAGNLYDKYGTRNPIARRMMDGFLNHLHQLIAQTGVREVHEAGCGEGLLTLELRKRMPELRIRASDFSTRVIQTARANAAAAGQDVAFQVKSIYNLRAPEDAAELVLCCEVLEHLKKPQEAMCVLARLANPYLIVTVPREPLWRALNLMRGKYLTAMGNTPGHVQHWSTPSFIALLREHVEVVRIVRPLPWTMVLCRAR